MPQAPRDLAVFAANATVVADILRALANERRIMILCRLLGVVLGYFASPAFYGISAFVGAGLIFAGISGWCGMAQLLAMMPWNRSRTASAIVQVG